MRAIDRGVDAATMEKLVALQMQVMEKNAEMAFNRAFQAFQSECPSVDKNRTADTGKFKYKFADLDHIASVVKPHLQRHGFSFTFDTDGDGNFRCHLHHVDGHSRTASVKLPEYVFDKINNLQCEGVRNSYGRRYALLSVLGITTGDEDADGMLPQTTQNKPRRAPVTSDELTAMWKFWRAQNDVGTQQEASHQFRTLLNQWTDIPVDRVNDPAMWDRQALEMCQRNLGMTTEPSFSV